MFTTLYPIAQGATLHLLISTEGEKLRVFVQPKPTGKDATISGPLSLLATPAELDAGFAEAITTWRTPSTPLIEQAKAAAAQPATRAAEDSDDESGPAGSTAPATKQAPRLTPKQKQAQAREAEEAKRKAARDKAAADRKAKADAAAKAKADKATTAAKAKADKAAEAAREREQKAKDKAAAKAKPAGGADANTEPADRDACLADARAYLAGNAASETPVKPSRSDYLNRYAPTTGRRYERLFTSFDEFMAAAQQEALPLEPAATEPSAAPPAAAPNVEAQQPGETNQGSGSETAAAASDAAAVASTPTTDAAPVTLKELHTTPAGNPATDAPFTGEPALEGEGDDDDTPLNLI